MKYTFICERRNAHMLRDEGLDERIVFETERECLPELIGTFEDFLRGCGYGFAPGEYLGIVEDEL